MDYLVARVLKLLGVGHLGTTGWILVVVAGLAGRLWDRKARNKASDRSGSKMPE